MSYEPMRELRAEQLDSISYLERSPRRAIRKKRLWRINPRLIIFIGVLGAMGFGLFKGVQWLLKDDTTPIPVLTPEVAEENIKSRPLETENTRIPNADKTIYREFDNASHDKHVERLLEEPEVPEVLMDQNLQAQKEAEESQQDPFVANTRSPMDEQGIQGTAEIAVAELFEEESAQDMPTIPASKTPEPPATPAAKPLSPTANSSPSPALPPSLPEETAPQDGEDLPAATLPRKSLRHALAETTIAIQDDATKIIDANIHQGKPMPPLKTEADYNLKIRTSPPPVAQNVTTPATPSPEKKLARASTQDAPSKRGPLSFKNAPREAAPSQSASSEPTQSQGTPGNYWLQLGSLESVQQAEQEWERLARMSSVKGALGTKRHKIQRVDLGRSKGIFHRILVGPFSQAEAKNSAQALRSNKVSCIVIQK